MAGKAGSDLIQLSTKKNLLIGVNQTGEEESMSVEKHHEYKLSLIANLFFGTQYESVSPESLLVGQLAGAQDTQSPSGGDDGGSGEEAKENPTE